MKLESRIKIAHGRCVGPGETIARLEDLIAPRFDFWLHEESVSDHLHWSVMFLEGRPEFRAMGKGGSREFAHAGVLAEAAEWLTARELDQLPGYVAARQEAIENPLPIEDLVPHIATATPEVIERIKDLDEAMHWVDGWSLINEKPVKVPLEYVRHIAGPNGKATGNFREEAIVHAANEIFERRAHVTVLKNRMVVPTIDPDSIEHPVIRKQVGFVRSKGIEVILKDLSFGGALPCVGAYFVDPEVPDDVQFHHFFKVGAGFDREEALMRAFTEYTQGRRSDDFVASGLDEVERDRELARLLQPDFRRLKTRGNDCDNFLSSFMFGMVPYRDASFLREGEVIPFDRGENYRDCLEDIAHAGEICRALGKDFIVVDLTDPEVGFPAVQVVIPGYSDVLPFHPADSRGLFQRWTRDEVMEVFRD